MDTAFDISATGWPLALRQAHALIRATRNPKYFAMADHFTTAWSATLDISERVDLLSGSNMAALDKLFEQATSKETLQTLYETVQHYTIRSTAAAFTRSPKQPETIEEAVALHVAFITLMGYERLAATSEPAAQQWLDLWQKKMDQQNRQQLEHSTNSLFPDQSYPDPAPDFEEAVKDYLEKFGETSALSVAVVGGMPFSPHIGFELLNGISSLLSQLSPLYRLAQDVQVDLDEVLNVAIYATAAEHHLSFGAARHQLKSGEIPVHEVNRRLKTVWEIHFANAQSACEARLAPYRHSQIASPLEHFSQALLRVAQKLTSNWKA